MWFRQLECLFALNKITNEEQQFMMAYPQLPVDICNELSEDTKTYNQLKAEILALNEKSKQKKIEEALGEATLDGKKPTQFLRSLRAKMKEIELEPSDEVLKQRLVQAMPQKARLMLTASLNLPLDDFGKVADNLHDLIDDYEVTQVQQKQPTFSTSNNNHRGRDERTRPSSPTSSKGNIGYLPYHVDQRQKICRAHIYFAGKARSCKPWCQWPGSKPQYIEPSSRQNSREASPVRGSGN